jgi:hypothetical protein
LLIYLSLETPKPEGSNAIDGFGPLKTFRDNNENENEKEKT